MDSGDKILDIPITQVVIPEGRYRKDLGDIDELADSIKAIGQLQPGMVKDIGDGKYELIAGERRINACQLAGKKTFKAIIYNVDNKEHRILEITENLLRKAFTWQEEVKAESDLHQIMKDLYKGWSVRKTAAKTGISLGKVSVDLNLAKAYYQDPEIFARCKTRDSAIKALQRHMVDETMAEITLRKSADKQTKKAAGLLFHGSCIDLIEKLPVESVNVIVTDPPYGIDIEDKKKHMEETTPKQRVYEDSPEEYRKLILALFEKVPRVMKKDSWIVMFHDIEHFSWVQSVLIKAGFTVDKIPGIWAKPIGQTNRPEVYMARNYEMFSYGYKGQATLVRPGLSNVLSFRGVNPDEKVHPVQKPLPLMEELLSRFALPGHVVLDPFAGGGTTLVAAIKMGMVPIGFELDKTYYEHNLYRLSKALSFKDEGRLDLCT